MTKSTRAPSLDALREKRSDHLRSYEIKGSKEIYELSDPKEVTALIVVLALFHHHDAELWPLWHELGKAMVAQYPSKTPLEVTSFVHMRPRPWIKAVGPC